MAALSAAAQSVLGTIRQAAEAGTSTAWRTRSEAVRFIEYTSFTGTLRVTFTGNSTSYIFVGVPEDLVARFVASTSKGGFYHRHLKGKYQA